MELRLAKIASLVFRHEFFKTDGLNWASDWPKEYGEEFVPRVIPTQTTERRLTELGFYLKPNPKGADIYAEVKQAGNKFFVQRPNDKNITLHFLIQEPLAGWNFFTRRLGSADALALYSNASGNKPTASNTLYLHNEVPASAAGVKSPGAVVRKTNKVYEALERTSSQPPGAAWADLGAATEFTTLSNTLPRKTSHIVVKEPSLANALVQIKNEYNHVLKEISFLASSEEKERSIELEGLPEGILSLHINGVQKERFFFSPDKVKPAFGVLAFAVQGNPAALPVSLRLDEEWLPVANGTGALAAGEINPLTFVVHFLHNTAKWRYDFNKNLNISNSDVPAEYEKLSDTRYQTKKAKALHRTANGPDFGLNQRLPAPQISVLGEEKNGSNQVEAYLLTTYVNV